MGNEADRERRFFELIWQSRPDVIVLDLSRTDGNGIVTIQRIREKCDIPILIVCAEADPRQSDYRISGAAECLHAPVDMLYFNRAIQHIIRLTRRVEPHGARQTAFAFNGITFRPDQNSVMGANGSSIKLTTSENDLLCYFVSRAWKACTRAQIAESLYGRHRPNSDRAIDVVINRLRKKLATVQSHSKHELVKTEFRRGYMFVADVSTLPGESSGRGPS